MTKRPDRDWYRVASAIPGRIRIQVDRRQNIDSVLYSCQSRLESLEGVIDSRAATHACSLIIRYDRTSAPVTEYVEQITAIVEAELAANRQPGASLVQRRRRPSRDQATDTAEVLANVSGIVRGLWRTVPGQSEVLHPLNLVNDRPSGFKPLAAATVAIALAAFEAVPLAISACALALAAIPIAQRAARGLGKRQLTVDELDLVNILLVALGGQVLTASIIAWLVSLGEVVRGKTVGHSRQSIARLLPPEGKPLPPDVRRSVEHLYKVELSNSQFQDEAMRCGNATAYPLFVLAVIMAVVTRDVGMIISILKPRTDYTAGLRLGIPVPILNSMIAARGHGPFITSAAILEKLTLLDAVLVTGTVEKGRAKTLSKLEAALAERGIRLLPMDDTAESPQGSLLERLTAEGFTFGIVATASDLADYRGCDVRILLDPDPDLDAAGADVYLMEGGLPGLVTALDIAFEAARISKQNTGMYAGAALTNLVTSLLRISPAPLSSAINAATMAMAAGNSLRPLRALPRFGDVRQLYKALPAPKPGS